jgi:hypothetical protein
MSMNESHADPFPTTPSSERGVQRAIFATTHWSVVLSARDRDSPRSAEALETLLPLPPEVDDELHHLFRVLARR